MEDFLRGIPKAELHVHLEGCLEPELLFHLQHRNGLSGRFASVEELAAAYDFQDLQSFLDLYYEGAAVLLQAQDFYDLTWSYLRRAKADNVRHVEAFFDPQTHTARGVAMATIVEGIRGALDAAREELDISSRLILCFVRHLPQEQALQCFEQALPFLDALSGVGLDSSEVGHPPRDFVDVFDRARLEGLHVVAHAGEEGPPEYVWEALDLLGAERIDHGVRSLEDPDLVTRLGRDQVPLTVCPLSNVSLKVFPSLAEHNLGQLLDAGLLATIHSDDPAYFGGYIADNYVATQRALELPASTMVQLARNSFEAAFLDDEDKRSFQAEIDEYLRSNAL